MQHNPTPFQPTLQIYIDASNPSRFITGRQGRTLIRQVAAGLQKHGLQKGDSVVIASFNDVGPTAYYAVHTLTR
jgi:long-subunit acyl-CoA synthetase (AMP-forming)